MILASSYGGHARRNLWQRGLAYARPPSSNSNRKVNILICEAKFFNDCDLKLTKCTWNMNLLGCIGFVSNLYCRLLGDPPLRRLSEISQYSKC